jgi:hypothetical protein
MTMFPSLKGRRLATAALVCAVGLAAAGLAGYANLRGASAVRTRHLAPNGNFGAKNDFLPWTAGFNLADVSGRRELDSLPEGVKGLVWVGACSGATEQFRTLVSSVIDHPKLFGFYLMDEPDPTGRWGPSCGAAELKAESDWIHERRPDASTFVLLMNLGPSAAPAFSSEYAPANSHVDLFGVSPYPCRTAWTTCDIDMIDRYVAAAVQSGIPGPRIVPTYQAFGGGTWKADKGEGYRLPTAAEMQSMLERWARLAPRPVFDYAYSWGAQHSDKTLGQSAELQSVFAQHNR